jgi:hypothetical protein
MVTSVRLPRPDASAFRWNWRPMCPSEHLVQFYEVDAALLEALSEYIGAGLRAGEAAVAITTEAHRAGLEERLRGDGLDLDSARASGQYVELEAVETLARIMADGQPDPRRFSEVVGTVVARAAEGRRPVRAFGEMVPTREAGADLRAVLSGPRQRPQERDGLRATRQPSDRRIARRRDHRRVPLRRGQPLRRAAAAHPVDGRPGVALRRHGLFLHELTVRVA